MGCNCNKNRASARRYPGTVGVSGSATQEYTLVSTSGTQTFGSKLEADAANARIGYTGVVKPKGK